MGFTKFGLSDHVIKGVAAAGYTTPTPIQSLAIKPALEGRDIIGCAQTGTGKTAAFVLPLLHRLANENVSHQTVAGLPVKRGQKAMHMSRKKLLLNSGTISIAVVLLVFIILFFSNERHQSQQQNPSKTLSNTTSTLEESVTLEEALEVYQLWKQKQKANNEEVGQDEPNLTSSTLQPSSFQKNLPEDPEVKEHSWPLPKRISISHSEGEGQGFAYTTNYTTAMALIGPDYKVGRFLPLVDIRAHRFNDNSYAANLGMIVRYIPKTVGAL